MPKSDVVLHADHLVKRYEDFIAVNDISFSVRKGEFLGILGPNGAGKTTTMRMIYGMTPITSGRLEVFGEDASREQRSIRARLGVTPQENSLDPDLNVEQNLSIYARYFDIPRAEAASRINGMLDFFHLQPFRKKRVDQLSGGMRRKLMMARALINHPEMLILDEPTTGLDPQARREIWQQVRQLREHEVTLLLTTHYMEEAGSLCDRIIIMNHGKIVEQGSPAELVERHQVGNLEDVFLKLTGEALREGV